MKLRDLVLALSLPFLTSCTTEKIISNKITSVKYYPIGLYGNATESTLIYNNQKIKIVSIKDDTGNTYHMVFAPRSSDLVNLIYNIYRATSILFFSNEKTEEVVIN